jgi:translation initiation factor IF-2
MSSTLLTAAERKAVLLNAQREWDQIEQEAKEAEEHRQEEERAQEEELLKELEELECWEEEERKEKEEAEWRAKEEEEKWIWEKEEWKAKEEARLAEEALQRAALRCIAEDEECRSGGQMTGIEDTGVMPVEPIAGGSWLQGAEEAAMCWHCWTQNLVCKSNG